MKTLFVCALALTALPAFGGKRIQMETKTLANSKVDSQEMLLDANRFRLNSPTTSVIFRTAGSGPELVILNKSRNEYNVVDQKTMQQISQQLQGAMAQMQNAMKNMPPEQRAMMEKMMKGKMPAAAAAATAPEPTVYTAKGSGNINGFGCTNYDGVQGGEKVVEVCVAQPAALKLSAADFKVFDDLKKFTTSLVETIHNAPFMTGIPNIMGAGFDGFPVLSRTFDDGKADTETTVKSITDAGFTDADFSLGTAKEVPLPIGNMGKR